MELRKELFFPTPIYFIDLDDADALNLFLLNRIYAWRDQDSAGIVRSNVRQAGSWHSATTMGQLAEYQIFVNKVSAQIDAAYADQLYSDQHQAHCLNMWANINPRNGYNRSHTHPGSLWSGVYYVQTPPDCGRIIFQDPRAQAHMLLPESNRQADTGPEQWSEVYHQAIAGRLILFPSWLRHEVEPNMSSLSSPEGNRISISFNYGQRLRSEKSTQAA